MQILQTVSKMCYDWAIFIGIPKEFIGAKHGLTSKLLELIELDLQKIRVNYWENLTKEVTNESSR